MARPGAHQVAATAREPLERCEAIAGALDDERLGALARANIGRSMIHHLGELERGNEHIALTAELRALHRYAGEGRAHQRAAVRGAARRHAVGRERTAVFAARGCRRAPRKDELLRVGLSTSCGDESAKAVGVVVGDDRRRQ